MAEMTNLISPQALGAAFRYGVYLRSDRRADRGLLAHELVHTAQYEWHGGFARFLRQYLYECMAMGCHTAPMEQEAKRVERKIELIPK